MNQEAIQTITTQERAYLRELAHKQAGYAALDVMRERENLWYAHNALNGERPPVVMEMGTFEADLLPPLRCESQAARWMETSLQRHIVNHEWIDDDKVVPGCFLVPWKIHIDPFGIEIPVERAADGHGKTIAYRWQHPIRTIREDFQKLKPSTFWVDRAGTQAMVDLAQDTLGDILPIEVQNHSLHWYAALSQKVVELMSLERMMLSLVDEPDEMHRLYAYLLENILAYARWQEQEGLLTLNNANHYVGAGSYGFTRALPAPDYRPGQPVRLKDLWLNINSQETVGISPRMYHQFMFPYYRDLAEHFGLVYYGCCEPVHDIWKRSVSQYPHLRKVSISAWCDEDLMGEALRGSGVIYSRKPSPNYIGVGDALDEAAFAAHIRRTLHAARGCALEIIFRDVYSLSGNKSKPGRAVAITREEIEKNWA